MPRWTPAYPATKQLPPVSRRSAAPQRAKDGALGRLPRSSDLTLKSDPYLTWAVLSNWRGQARIGQWQGYGYGEPRMRILLCAHSLERLQALQNSGLVLMPPAYLDPVPGSKEKLKPACYATGELRRSDLAAFIEKYPDIQFELAAPLKDQGAPLQGDAKGYFGQQTDLDAGVTKSAFSPVSASAVKRAAITGGAIALFDYGCPFIRREYEDPAGDATRIAALWHQEDFKPEKPWVSPYGFGYGRELGNTSLNKLRKQAQSRGKTFDEARAYSGLNYLIDYDNPRRRVFLATHGAHVLDVAGGRPDPVGKEDNDDASGAKLVFVQMPDDTAWDSSGASLGAYLLDALRYMLWVTDPDAPLVVNVSYGNTAGPHDGSSLIERAMDDLLEQRPRNFAIVLAAGNSRRLGLHAARRVAQESTALFRIDVAAGDRTDTFVEFWYTAAAPQQLDFRVRLPGGDWCEWVAPDGSVELLDNTGSEIIAALISRKKVPNGQPAMVLLALCPSEAPDDDDGALVQPGLWEVEVRLVTVKGDAGTVQIDAWIKRDDSRPFRGDVQSTFLGVERADTENTLNGLATGQHTMVASGFRWSDGMAVDYASTGPRRTDPKLGQARQLPLVYGMCEWDSVDPGIRASAVRSGETFLMNGTSVAAPVVARQIYKLMAADKSGGLDKFALLEVLRLLAEVRGSMLRVD